MGTQSLLLSARSTTSSSWGREYSPKSCAYHETQNRERTIVILMTITHSLGLRVCVSDIHCVHGAAERCSPTMDARLTLPLPLPLPLPMLRLA